MNNEKYIWTKQQEIELERFGDFMATMFEKYGNEVFSKDGQRAEDSALVHLILWVLLFVINSKMRYNLFVTVA